MIRIYIALGGALAILIALAIFGYHERNLEHTKDATHDTQASVKVEKAADAETEANAVASALAHQGAKNAQKAVDDYLAAHPVDLSVRNATPVSRGCVPEARTLASGVAGAGAGAAPSSAVPGGGENLALAEVVSSFARLAILDSERQAR